MRYSTNLSGVMVIAISLIGIAGCGTTYRGHVSVPQDVGGWKYVWHHESNGVVVNLGAGNLQEGSLPESSLLIWMYIRPPDGKVVTIEPLLVTVTPAGAEDAIPATMISGPVEPRSQFINPQRAYCENRTYYLPAGGYSQHFAFPKRTEQVISIEGRQCLGFRFETDASPDKLFTLGLRGLSLDGNPLAFPDIRFRKARYSFTVGLEGEKSRLSIKPPKGL